MFQEEAYKIGRGTMWVKKTKWMLHLTKDIVLE